MKAAVLATAFGVALCGAAVASESFPERPVTAVVQMAPGGSTDLVVRAVQHKMGEALGRSLIVENRAGAGGLIGLRHVLTSPPDGYTVGIASGTSHGVAVNVYENLPYDPLTDFKPVGGIVVAPGVLITNKETTPDCKFETLLKKLEENPGELKYGSAGIATLAHITGQAFLAETGQEMLHVPYRGLGPALIDLYSGSIDVVFDNISSARAHINSGKVCALAIQSPERVPGFEDIPTYAEVGYPQLNRPTWFGMIVRSETPDDVVNKLNAALNEALSSEEIKQTYAAMGVAPLPESPEQFGARMREEIQYWADVVDKIDFEKLKI